LDESQPRSKTWMDGCSFIASVKVDQLLTAAQLSPHGALVCVVGTRPGDDFVDGAQATFAKTSVLVHLAQADAG